MFFTILFSTTVIVIGIYLFFGLPWKHHELKDEMIQYLEKRYKDDFSLGTLHYQIVNKKCIIQWQQQNLQMFHFILK